MITFILDHIDQAKARLLEQYKNKTNLNKLLECLVQPIQDLEDVFKNLHDNRSIDNSVGKQLDGIGGIVGLPRPLGLSDDDYRFQIKAKIIQNLNQGTPEEVIAAAKFFLDAAYVYYNEVYPASVEIYTYEDLTQDEVDLVLPRLESFLPAGVKLGVFGYFDEENPFLFNTGGGFGSVNDANLGGLLAGIYQVS